MTKWFVFKVIMFTATASLVLLVSSIVTSAIEQPAQAALALKQFDQDEGSVAALRASQHVFNTQLTVSVVALVGILMFASDIARGVKYLKEQIG